MAALPEAKLRRYLNEQNPLGPSDAAVIRDTEAAAWLFDPHNASFNELLRKDVSVVIGRRGSGKTALLNSYLYRPYLPANSVPDGKVPDFDLYDYSVVIPIIANRLFENMQPKAVGPTGMLRPIESITEDWAALIIDYGLAKILDGGRASVSNNAHLTTVEKYITAPEVRQKSEAYLSIWGPSISDYIRALFRRGRGDELAALPSRDDAVDAATLFLRSRKSSAVIIFDSLDEYEVGNPQVDRMVGALMRFVARFNAESDAIKIKLGLPAEIFPEIQRSSANPLKDFVGFDQVRWSATELTQIAAYRYRLFLSIYDPPCFDQVSSINLNSREGVRKFWGHFLPQMQTNRYGHSEDPMTYMLRHTQLLPRQLFRILQRVIRSSHARTGGFRYLDEASVVEAIENMEPIIAGEIIQGFKYVYPYSEDLGKAIFNGLPTVFSYDQLEDRWRKVGRSMMHGRDPMFELVHFTEMLLRMGIVGVVDTVTDRYVGSQFAYHMLMPFTASGNQDFTMHPIFSRYFACEGNKHGKSILPHGATLDAATDAG